MRRDAMRMTVWLLGLLTAANLASAQSQGLNPDNVYVEALGGGGFASVNAEWLVTQALSVRAGAGFDFHYGIAGTLPIGASTFAGTERHKAELGVGATFFAGQEWEFGFCPGLMGEEECQTSNDPISGVFLTSRLGYRYQGEWIVFRLGYVLRHRSDDQAWPVGVALGLKL